MVRYLLIFAILSLAAVSRPSAAGADPPSYSRASVLSVSDETHSFGEIKVGKQGRFVLRIVNRGKKPVAVRKIAVSGADGRSFKVERPAVRQIPARGRASLVLRFSPKRSGGHHAIVRITTSAGVMAVVLDGAGVNSIASGPHLSSIYPESGPAGTTVTLIGKGFGSDPSKVEVLHGGYPLSVLSVAPELITAQIPNLQFYTWDGTRKNEFWVRLSGANLSNVFYFTITGIPPMHPAFTLDSLSDSASVGDTLELWGEGFSPRAEQNIVSFAGAAATANAYLPGSGDPNHPFAGGIRVVVPVGAQSGPLRVKRLDGWPDDWYEWGIFEIVPRSNLTLSAGAEAAGLLRPGRCDKEVLFLSGAGFSGVYNGVGYYVPGGSEYVHLQLQTTVAMTETQCLIQSDAGLYCVLEAGVYNTLGMTTGMSVRLRVWGQERTNRQLRYSNWIDLPVRATAVPGGEWHIASGDTLIGGATEVKIPRGDMLVLYGYKDGWHPEQRFTSRLSARGLFDGEIALTPYGTSNEQGCKTVIVSQAGAFTLRDSTTGWSIPVHVLDEGVPSGYDVAVPGLAQNGGVFGFGGARLSIPANALPLHGGSGDYTLHLAVNADARNSLDPEQTNGDRNFVVTFDPNPPELLQPITILLPYSSAGRATPPRFGLWDTQGNAFLTLAGAVADESTNKLTVRLPTGAYPWMSPASPRAGQAVRAGASGTISLPPTPVTLNNLTSAMGVVALHHANGLIEDDGHKLWVDFITDSGSDEFVPESFARSVLSLAVTTYDYLKTLHWPPPGSQVTFYIRNLGLPNVIQGRTTTGFFGQPWVYINSELWEYGNINLTYTGTAHETSHLFQRQLTTNVNYPNPSWLDEGAADWTAYETFPGNFSVGNISAGVDFPTVGWPANFGGFDATRMGAAGGFVIWLENEYPGSTLQMYRIVNYSPSYYWGRSRTVVEQAVRDLYGGSIDFGTITRDFALEYWLETYAPITGMALEPLADNRIYPPAATPGNWAAVAIIETRPAYSSKRYSMSIDPAHLSGIENHYAAARAASLGAGEDVYIYGDSTNLMSSPPGALTRLAWLYGGHLTAPLKDSGGNVTLGKYRSYRILVINGSGSNTAPDIRIAAPHTGALSPSSGSKSGGYTVHIQGTGFGTATGTVTCAGLNRTPSAWSGTDVSFTMPQLSNTGAVTVRLTTAEGVSTLDKDFTVTP